MKLIYDFKEVMNFFEILPPLEEDGVYFVSLSARNKYLSEKEKEIYGLSRTEMFARTIIRDESAEAFYNKIQLLEQQLNVMKTKTGEQMPSHALICYVNLHSSSTMTATKNFMKRLPEIVFEAVTDNDIQKKFKYIDKEWLTEVQKSKGDRKLLDIDFDVDDYSIVEDFIIRFNEHAKGPVKHVIATKGGWHVVLERDQINFDFHPIVQELDKKVPDGEVIINKNNMVPLPGTLQGGYEVKLEKQ